MKNDNAVYWEDQSDVYKKCPLVYITENIIDWYQEHLYNTEYGCSISYGDQSARFVSALNYYKACYNRFVNDKQSVKKDGDLSLLYAGLKSRKQDGKEKRN